MRLVRARTAALALAFFCGTLAAAAEAPPTGGVRWFAGSFDEALAQARKEKKLVLFDAWAKWCGPCRTMEREVWSRDDLARSLDREVVPIRVEVDRFSGVGITLGDRYAIQALPLMLFLDPANGSVLERLEGARTPEDIVSALDRARLKVGASQQLAAASGDSTALVRLAGQLVRTGNLTEAREAAEKALALDPDCRRDDADDAALLLADLQRRAGEAKEEFATLEDAVRRCPQSSGAGELWRRLVELAPAAGGPEGEERILRSQAERRPDDPDSQRALANFLSRQRRDLAAAERAAQRAIDLAPDDPASLAAMAQVRLGQQRYADAKSLVDRAIAIDPHDPDLRELRLRIAQAAHP